LPRDAEVLAEFNETPALALLHHKGSVFLLAGFDILQTNWPFEPGFVMFCYNAISFLGMQTSQAQLMDLHVGQPIIIEGVAGETYAKMNGPNIADEIIKPNDIGTIRFARTDLTGIYNLRIPDQPERYFAVNLHQMADFLLNDNSQANTDNDSTITNFDSICRQLASMRIGKGIMIILSDFLFKQGYDSGLRRLIGRNYDLYVMQVLAPEELKPQLAGDLKLIDIEDADDAEISVNSALLKFYRRNVTAYCNELKDFCVRRGATYMLVKSSDAIEMLVLNYLQRIGLLH